MLKRLEKPIVKLVRAFIAFLLLGQFGNKPFGLQCFSITVNFAGSQIENHFTAVVVLLIEIFAKKLLSPHLPAYCLHVLSWERHSYLQ